MSNKVQCTCIICYTTWEDEKKKSRRDEALLHTFCHHFEIPLENVQNIQWNFEEESLPSFCVQCQEVADRLVRLQQELEAIQESILHVRNIIKDQIVNSSSDHHHNLDDRREKKNSRVNMIRDFIRGPSLNIPKLKSRSQRGGGSLKKVKNKSTSKPTSSSKVYGSGLEHDVDDHNNYDDDSHSIEEFNYLDKSDPVQDPLDPVNEGVEATSPENERRYPPRARKRKADVVQINPYGDSSSDTDDPLDLLSLPLKEEVEDVMEQPNQQESTTRTRKSKADMIQTTVYTDYEQEDHYDNDLSDSYSEHEDDIDDDEEEEENYKRIKFYRGEIEIDDDFEPSSEDLEDFDKEMRKKFVIRKHKSKARRHSEAADPLAGAGDGSTSDRPRRRMVVQLTEPGRYSYCDYEFQEITGGGFACCSCELKKTYKERRGMMGHIRHHHLNETRGHLCSMCGRAFYKENELANHTKVHEEGRGVICHLCGGKFMTESILERHIRMVHERPYDFPCTFCTEKFRSDVKLQYHVQKYHQEPTILACQHCPTTFKWKENFQRHLQRFHGQELPDNIRIRRYKKKSNKGNNNVGESSSTSTMEDRPFQCAHCIMKYRREVDLAIHTRRIHTAEQPTEIYPCQFCDNKYKSAVTLRRHEIKNHQDRPGFEWKRELTKNKWLASSSAKPTVQRPRRDQGVEGSGQQEEEEQEIVAMDADEQARLLGFEF